MKRWKTFDSGAKSVFFFYFWHHYRYVSAENRPKIENHGNFTLKIMGIS